MFMRRFLTFALIAFFVFLSGKAFADDPRLGAARQKFLKGDYVSAIEAGKDIETAAGLALAAEAMSAQVLLGQVEKRRKTATKARKLAKKALKRDPDSHEANIQFALARGFETQSSSPVRVWRKGLIKKSKDAIIAVREKFPEDPRGDALMGAWHLGIVRRAGEGRAKDWFEATEADGIAFYESALKQSPDDIIILSNFATTLLAIDSAKYGDTAKALMDRAFAAEPSYSLEASVQNRLRKLEPLYDDPEALQSMAEAILDDENDEEDLEALEAAK